MNFAKAVITGRRSQDKLFKILSLSKELSNTGFCLISQIFGGLEGLKGDLQEEGESFNVTFEKIHSTQVRWVVQHFELREELCLSIVEKVIPAYVSFLERFKKHIEGKFSDGPTSGPVLINEECELDFGQNMKIFDGIEHDSCFSESIKDAEIQLMNFAEALINSFRSPEKLFKFLDLSKRLSNTWVLLDPTYFSLTKGPEGAPVLRSSDKIGEVVRAILSDFRKSVAYEMSTISGVRGTIHFLTKYKKSKYYKDATLAHLFMANNLHCIVKAIRKLPELEEMIGEEYLNKLSENYLRQAISNYQSSTCERLLYCWRDEEEGQRYFSVCFSLRGNLRRRLRSFNATFEQIRSTQAKWVVRHLELREELCLSIVEKMIPAYASFLERFRKRGEGRKYAYIKYSVEDLQTLIIEDFFQKYHGIIVEMELSKMKAQSSPNITHIST
ncbi:hypothetical protein LguiB_027945 [Lonicera macranthoides]